MTSAPQPTWNPEDKPTSLRSYAEWLHEEAKDVFTRDGTHAQILFLFSDDGLASMNPIPPKTESKQLLAGITQAVQEHGLFGVITVAEAWTYFPRNPKDHVAVQLMHNEMGVGDLMDGHKTEALMIRMESRDGDSLTWIDPIIRDGDNVALGNGMVLPREKCLKQESYFGTEDD